MSCLCVIIFWMRICLKSYNFKFPGSLQDSFKFYFLLVQVSYQRSSQGLLPSPVLPEHVLSLVDLQAHARAFHSPVVIQDFLLSFQSVLVCLTWNHNCTHSQCCWQRVWVFFVAAVVLESWALSQLNYPQHPGNKDVFQWVWTKHLLYSQVVAFNAVFKEVRL